MGRLGKLVDHPTDEELMELMNRSAEWVGMQVEWYMAWVKLDPEGAADELARAMKGDRNRARAVDAFAEAIRRSEGES